MKLTAKLAKIILLLVSIQYVTVGRAFATDEKYAAIPLTGTNNQIQKDSSNYVQDTVFFNMALRPTQTTYSVKNLVTFKINEFSNIALPDTFKVTISFKVYFTKLVSGTEVQDSSALQTIFVEYNKFRNYQNKALYSFEGGYSARVKILSVTSVSSSGTFSSYKNALMLENQITVTREYAFNPLTDYVASVSGTPGSQLQACDASGEYVVSWGKLRVANEYDLEWTYLDSVALINYYVPNTSTLDARKVFQNNASRVSITNESYAIPLLYDNKGVLFFRVRPVVLRPGGQRLEGNWSSNYTNGMGVYGFAGHEIKLNWQASTSFAEEGKRKSVVQYFDGSLRNRQTVTKDNSNCKTIVAETLYDYQGRPAIQVLPTPTLSSLIGYTPNFNRDVNGANYDKSIFDGDTSAILSSCNALLPGMGNTVSGASRYYSTNNEVNVYTAGSIRYIPSAKLYPFAETRYTPDNTGRIAMQGGVGKEFQINQITNSFTHETKYFYGSADPEELDALFGTEVGNASHYSKNMVKDANGQYSVSYTDMHGRTIATALAGKPESKMDTLSSSNTKLIVKKLLDTTNNLVTGRSIVSSKALIVTSSGMHRFQYSLTPDKISVQTCDSATICYDCLYDLDITISNDCSNPAAGPITIRRTNLRADGIMDTTCGGPAKTFPGVDTSVYLTPGSYMISKTLTISPKGLDKYNEIFLRRNTCKTLQQIIQEQQQIFLAQVQCHPTCQSCTDSLGTLESYVARYYLRNNIPVSDTGSFRDQAVLAYSMEKASCDDLCSSTGLHTSAREQMLADMTAPYGQYAEIDSAYDPHNIFYSNAVTGLPRFKLLVGGDFYKDAFGRPDSIVNSAGQRVPPTDVSITKEDFINNFKASWATTLLPLHPEYCFLQKAESYAASYTWDERFEKVDSYAQAVDSGFLNPSNFTGLPSRPIFNSATTTHRDPMFTSLATGSAAAFKDSLFQYVNTGSGTITAWSMATVMAHCGAEDDACFNLYKNADSAFSVGASCSGELDFAWRFFREMYLFKKTEIVNKLIHSSCPTPEILSWHTLSFPIIDVMDGTHDIPSDPAAGADSLAQFIDENCRGYVTQWLEELHPCNLLQTDIDILFPRMIEVCKKGGDLDHVFGSSTTPPGTATSAMDVSFEQIMKNVLGDRYDSTCNAYLITAPLPYGQQPSYSDVEIWDKPDSCQCTKISGLYNQFQQAGGGNFSDFVFTKTGTRMYPGVLDTLRRLCSGEIACQFLATPIVLPVALQCNTGPVCISCTEMKVAYNQFKVEFPGIDPTYDNNDSVRQNRNKLFGTFMNRRFGFVKDATDYLDFMSTCALPVKTDSSYCDSLNLLLRNYQQLPNKIDTAKNDAGQCDTSHLKVSITNSFTHTGGFLKSWMSNGVWKNPLENYAPTPNFIYSDTLCLPDSSFSSESRLRFPFNDKGYESYVNGGKTAYTYGSLINAYSFENKNIGIYLINGKQWKAAVPALNDSIYGYLQVIENGVQTIHSYFPLGIKYLGEWVNLKLEIKNLQLRVLLNDVQKDTFTLASPVTKFYSQVAEPYGPDFQMDWLKMFDKQDRLRYFEEFNGCENLAKQTLPKCQPDCKQDFVTYFNAKSNTQYTFTQIDSLYFNRCGIHPDPCYKSPIDCNNMQQALKEYYLSQYSTTHDSMGVDQSWFIGSNYIDRSGYPYSIKDFIKAGILSTADSVVNNRGDFGFGFQIPMCVDNGFSLSIKLRTKPGSNAFTGQPMFYQYFTNGGYLLTEFTGYGSYNGWQGGYRDVGGNYHGIYDFSQNDSLYTVFDTWKTYKVSFKNNRAYTYINDSLKASIYFPGTFDRLRAFSMANWYNTETEYDWVKIQDASGKIIYQEDFNDYTNFSKADNSVLCQLVNCSGNFTYFFNNRFHTNYSYTELLELYKGKCNIYFEPCTSASGPTLCGDPKPVFENVDAPDLSACADSTLFSVGTGTLLYNAYRDSLVNSFNDRYLEKCLAARYNESFTVSAPVSEFHYTLYYYDQAGNLVKTVPPAGVDMSKFSSAGWSDSVKNARALGNLLTPAHGLKTQYRYNTLNQVVAQTTPDAGQSQFWYDRLGRLVISQNAKQKAASSTEANALYSYTNYDYLGRIAEVGQVRNTNGSEPVTATLTRNTNSLSSWLTARYNVRSQLTQTFYDTKYAGFAGSEDLIVWQSNLRNRVSYTSYTDTATLGMYNQASFYSYDIHGNVDTLIQDYGSSAVTGVTNIMNVQTVNANRWKRMVYRYDLISGKVNHVAYQPPRNTTYYPDMLYHRYSYDAENRLVLAETSVDSLVWEKDARYEYYKHGPLSRMVLGEQLVQGIDYAYTLQGWLKGVNANSIANPDDDMGTDGKVSTLNQYTARDAYSFSLDYFIGDYQPV
ncbi:MAG: hypothetical protein JWQ27_2333, partial [Ferruginibacter sp.]|nr:hypothetical protein [Ferruginibacter sp.]